MATAVEGFQIADGAIPLSKLAQSGASIGQAPLWNGTAYVPGPVGGGGGGTLDAAYDFGGSGAGRVITADAGAVHIDKGVNDANNALEIAVTNGSGVGLSVAMSGSASGLAATLTGGTVLMGGSNTNQQTRVNYTAGGFDYLIHLANTSLTLNGAPSGEAASFRADGSLRLGYNTAQIQSFTSGAGTSDGQLTAFNYNVVTNGIVGEGTYQAYVADTRAWVDGSTAQTRGGGLGFEVVYGPSNGSTSAALIQASKQTAVQDQFDSALSFYMMQTNGHGLERMRLLSLTSTLQGRSDFTYAWTSGAASAATDTGLSRTAAATIAIGNGTAGDTSGTLRLRSVVLTGSTSGSTTLSAGATPTPTTYTWPSAPIAGNFLQTDGSGNLSWAAAGGGGGGTLDAAYDFGGAGAGRTITVDSGAVRLDKGVNDSTNALEVVVTSGTGLAALFSGASISVPGTGARSERFGLNAQANGADTLAIGTGAVAAFDCSIAIGVQFSGQAATARGVSSGPGVFPTIAMGLGAQAGPLPAAVIAAGKRISDCIAIGDGVQAGIGSGNQADCIAIGDGSVAGGNNAADTNSYFDCIAIGDGSVAGANGGAYNTSDAIAIGDGSSAQGLHDCIAIGDGATAGSFATDHDNIAIGDGPEATGTYGISIGDIGIHNSGAHDYVILGHGSVITGALANSFVCGAPGHGIADVWFGTGPAANGGAGATIDYTLHGSDGRLGAVNGGTVNIAGGRGLASGDQGGSVHVQVAIDGAATTLVDAMFWTRNASTVQGPAGLLTTATDGFLYIESCAGPPTGVPTAFSNRVAIVYDRTNDDLYAYNGSWKKTHLA